MCAEKLGQAGQKRRHEKMARQCHANSALITKHVFTVFHHMTGTPFESKPLKVAIPRGANAVLIKKCCYTQSNYPGQFGKGWLPKAVPCSGSWSKRVALLQGRIWNWEMEKWRPRCDGHKNDFFGAHKWVSDGLVDMHVAQPFCSTSEFALFLRPSNAKNLRCPWQVWPLFWSQMST